MSCGAKNEFQVKKPLFCGGCGKPLNRADSATASNSVKRLAVVEDDDDDISGDFDTQKLSRAWVAETDNFSRPTFGDLLNNPVQRTERMPRPESDAGLGGDDLLKKIRSECARPKDTKEIGA